MASGLKIGSGEWEVGAPAPVPAPEWGLGDALYAAGFPNWQWMNALILGS